MKRYVIVVLGILFFSCHLFAQGELDLQEKIFYRNERSFAIALNSNGLGANFTYAKRITGYKKNLYSIGLATIKHPKEVKTSTINQFYQTSGSFVYGKLNNFYNFRLGIGKQEELYRKVDRGGISIRFFYNGGLDIGLLKPIYYIMSDQVLEGQETNVRKFNTGHANTNYIIQKASYFKGFDELSVVPGIYGKIGLTFEYSKLDEILHALETGVIIDAYPKKIPIMAYTNHNYAFFTLYIGYRFGKVIDAQFKSKQTRIDELLNE